MDAVLFHERVKTNQQARAYQKWIATALRANGFYLKWYNERHFKHYTKHKFPGQAAELLEQELADMRLKYGPNPNRQQRTRLDNLRERVAAANLLRMGDAPPEEEIPGFTQWDYDLFHQLVKEPTPEDPVHPCVRPAILNGAELDIMIEPSAIANFIKNDIVHRVGFTQRRMLVAFRTEQRDNNEPMNIHLAGFICFAVPTKNRVMNYETLLGYQRFHGQADPDEFHVPKKGALEWRGNAALKTALEQKEVLEIRYVCADRHHVQLGKFLTLFSLLEISTRTKKIKYILVEPAFAPMYHRYEATQDPVKRNKYEFKNGYTAAYKIMYASNLLRFYNNLGFTTEVLPKIRLADNTVVPYFEVMLPTEDVQIAAAIDHNMDVPVPCRWLVRKMNLENPIRSLLDGASKRALEKSLGREFYKVCKMHPLFKEAGMCL